jgi:DNA-binding NarL/FixJ family response regulator
MQMTHKPEIAIIEANTLTCIGLRNLIERMMPFAIVRTFNTFEQFVCDTPDMYFHYFISSQILLEHSTFFIERKNKTIVLTNGTAGTPQMARFHTLNIFLTEEKMVRALLQLQQSAHAHGKHLPKGTMNTEDPNGLSAREIEVLTLIVKGLTNKEIADKLFISITTVISHRKNLMEKLNVRSVSGLTIYAVMNGYIEADRI